MNYILRNCYLTIKLIFYIIQINNYNLLSNFLKYVLLQSLAFDLINIGIISNYIRYYTILLYLITIFFENSYTFLIIFILLDILSLNLIVKKNESINCNLCFKEIIYKTKNAECEQCILNKI